MIHIKQIRLYIDITNITFLICRSIEYEDLKNIDQVIYTHC